MFGESFLEYLKRKTKTKKIVRQLSDYCKKTRMTYILITGVRVLLSEGRQWLAQKA